MLVAFLNVMCKTDTIVVRGNHMQCGITQSYLPPGSGDFSRLYSQAKLLLELVTPEGCKAEFTRWQLYHMPKTISE